MSLLGQELNNEVQSILDYGHMGDRQKRMKTWPSPFRWHSLNIMKWWVYTVGAKSKLLDLSSVLKSGTRHKQTNYNSEVRKSIRHFSYSFQK